MNLHKNSLDLSTLTRCPVLVTYTQCSFEPSEYKALALHPVHTAPVTQCLQRSTVHMHPDNLNFGFPKTFGTVAHGARVA